MIEIGERTCQRDRGLDVAKGVLILLLVVYHFAAFAARQYDVSNAVVDVIYRFHDLLITSYFMQTFFVVSGMCSNFEGPIRPFIIKQIKTLLFPAFVFSVVSSCVSCLQGMSIVSVFGNIHHILCHGYSLYWFCVALFCGKIVYRILHQVLKRDWIELVILFGLSFLGSFLNDLDYGVNYAAHQQALDLIVFLAIGRIFKKQIVMLKVGAVSVMVYCLSIFAVGEPPYVMGDINITMATWPVHILLASTGSFVILSISRVFSRLAVSDVIETIGKNSLVIYLTQYRLLVLQLAAVAGVLDGAGGERRHRYFLRNCYVDAVYWLFGGENLAKGKIEFCSRTLMVRRLKMKKLSGYFEFDLGGEIRRIQEI